LAIHSAVGCAVTPSHRICRRPWAHDQQPIEQPKRHGRHHEQIHRRNAIRMVAQKSLPARHILGDAGLPNVDAELEQFAMNARRTPQWVGNAHLPN
jgi:hypothetical protein